VFVRTLSCKIEKQPVRKILQWERQGTKHGVTAATKRLPVLVSRLLVCFEQFQIKTSCGAGHNKPRPLANVTDLLTPVLCCHLANATDSELWLVITNNLTFDPPTRSPELTQNWIRSSHGHSTPSLKISCKSVQPFSRNLADKETNKETKKSFDYNTPSPSKILITGFVLLLRVFGTNFPCFRHPYFTDELSPLSSRFPDVVSSFSSSFISLSVNHSFFHSRLKTYLLLESFPSDFFVATRLISQTYELCAN